MIIQAKIRIRVWIEKKKDHIYYSLHIYRYIHSVYSFLKITMVNNKIFINILISQKIIPKVQTDPNNNGWTPIHFAVCKVLV